MSEAKINGVVQIGIVVRNADEAPQELRGRIRRLMDEL